MVSEDTSSGVRSSLADPTAASIGVLPSLICTMIDSAMTIALSTNIPSAMMSAARET